MSEAERIERLTELARAVWPDRPLEVRCVEVHPLVNGDAWEVIEQGDNEEVCYLRVSSDRALDALEAALLVLSGEVTLTDVLGGVYGRTVERQVAAENAAKLAKVQALLKSRDYDKSIPRSELREALKGEP